MQLNKEIILVGYPVTQAYERIKKRSQDTDEQYKTVQPISRSQSSRRIVKQCVSAPHNPVRHNKTVLHPLVSFK